MTLSAGIRTALAAFCAIVLASCHSSSSSTTTMTAPPATASIATSDASGFSGGVGAATVAALESGGFQAGVGGVGSPRPANTRIVADGTAGQIFGTAACPVSGKEDLVFVRTFTPANNDVDLSALKAVFTTCKLTVSGVTQQMDGELAMSGHFFGASTGKTSDIHMAGTLVTSLGSCTMDGTVSATGNFSGTACGQTITQSTSPATPSVNVTGTWTGTVSVVTSGTSAGSTITVAFQQSGQHLTATVTSIPGLKGAVVSFDLTQTAASGSTVVFPGSESVRDGGNCSPQTLPGGMTVDTATNTMTGTFSGKYTDCLAGTVTYSLQKQ